MWHHGTFFLVQGWRGQPESSHDDTMSGPRAASCRRSNAKVMDVTWLFKDAQRLSAQWRTKPLSSGSGFRGIAAGKSHMKASTISCSNLRSGQAEDASIFSRSALTAMW